MNTSKQKWKVVIPVGCFMCGTHSFTTEKAAQKFADEFNEVHAASDHIPLLVPQRIK